MRHPASSLLIMHQQHNVWSVDPLREGCSENENGHDFLIGESFVRGGLILKLGRGESLLDGASLRATRTALCDQCAVADSARPLLSQSATRRPPSQAPAV